MRRRTLAGLAVALAVAGCGETENQAADEPKRDYRLEVVAADFPERQHLAERSRMRIQVLNRDTVPVPNLAITLKRRGEDGTSAPSTFSTNITDPGVADRERPIWIVDEAPRGGEVAYASTWALGELPAGQTRTFEWQVTAMQPGRHTIQFEVAPGLDGNARAVGRPGGTFTVVVDGDPADARVRGDGEVIRNPDAREPAEDDDGSNDAEPGG